MRSKYKRNWFVIHSNEGTGFGHESFEESKNVTLITNTKRLKLFTYFGGLQISVWGMRLCKYFSFHGDFVPVFSFWPLLHKKHISLLFPKGMYRSKSTWIHKNATEQAMHMHSQLNLITHKSDRNVIEQSNLHCEPRFPSNYKLM